MIKGKKKPKILKETSRQRRGKHNQCPIIEHMGLRCCFTMCLEKRHFKRSYLTLNHRKVSKNDSFNFTNISNDKPMSSNTNMMFTLS